MFLQKFTVPLFSLLLCLSIASSLQAHTEHEEIQVKSTFKVNLRQQLNAVTMVWLCDTFSSEDMLKHEKDINRLAKLLVSDLARFNYFTRLNADDRRLVANNISQYKLVKVKDRDNNPALQLTFTLLLNKPINIKSLKNIKIEHADPTGKGIFFYDSANDIVLSNELKSKCHTQVKEKAEFKEGEFPQIAAITCRA